MPFDPKGFKMPDADRVTVLPPSEGGGGGPARLTIRIEIDEGRRRPRQGRASGWMVVWTLATIAFALLLLAACEAHAERWQENRVGGTTYWNNLDTGTRGQERYMPDGSIAQEFQDSKGRVTHCTIQTFGKTIDRSCR